MNRFEDVITGVGECTEELCVFKDFPVNMMSSGKDDWTNDPVYDMRFGIDPVSGVIQLTDTVPKEMIYTVNHSNGIGTTWKRQYESFAGLLSEYAPSTVLEIGGSSGVLERTYKYVNKNSSEYKWYIIDPVDYPRKDTDAVFIKGFFPEDMPENINTDMIVHSHVMEHMYSPRVFLKDIKNILPYGGRMIFSVPNLKRLFEEQQTSVLTFEHTVYLSEDYIDYLLDEFGFETEKKIDFEGHSLIYSTVKCKELKKKGLSFEGLYEKNRSVFMEWERSNRLKMKRLNDIIKEFNEVYLFGAHVTAQYYFAFGLDKSKITGILDNDPFKQNNRVSGTKWLVQSPEILSSKKEPAVILPYSPYSQEIKEQTLRNVNKNTKFIEIEKL